MTREAATPDRTRGGELVPSPRMRHPVTVTERDMRRDTMAQATTTDKQAHPTDAKALPEPSKAPAAPASAPTTAPATGAAGAALAPPVTTDALRLKVPRAVMSRVFGGEPVLSVKPDGAIVLATPGDARLSVAPASVPALSGLPSGRQMDAFNVSALALAKAGKGSTVTLTVEAYPLPSGASLHVVRADSPATDAKGARRLPAGGFCLTWERSPEPTPASTPAKAPAKA